MHGLADGFILIEKPRFLLKKKNNKYGMFCAFYDLKTPKCWEI